MDGKTLLYELNNALNEAGISAFIDPYTSYEYLWDAACKFAERTNFLKTSQAITTTLNTTNYTVKADFLKLYLMDINNNFILGYTPAGQNMVFIQWRQYDDIVYRGIPAGTTYPIPSWWTVLNTQTGLSASLSSTATATGSLSNGTSTLTDSTASFTTTVAPGDRIHDTTDSSDGVVLSVTDATHLVAALFNGTNNFFTNGDAYTLQPQGRIDLIVNPGTANAGDTITFYYVQRPIPVFSSLGIYPFPIQHMKALVSYAVWRYKYRDREPIFADHLYQYFEMEIKRVIQLYKSSINKRDMRFTFKRRTGIP